MSRNHNTTSFALKKDSDTIIKLLAEKFVNFARANRGMASILITLVLLLVTGLLILGFGQIARREVRQSLDNQLSTQAFYAAESGVNDALNAVQSGYLSSNPTGKTNCNPDASGPLSNPTSGGYPSNYLDSTHNVQFTCLLLNPFPTNLQYISVGTDQSTVVPVNSVTTTAPTLPPMTYSAVGPLWSNQAWDVNLPNTLSVVPQGLGDLMVLTVNQEGDVSSAPSSDTNIVTSVAGGGVTTWHLAIDSPNASSSPHPHEDREIWYGQVTSLPQPGNSDTINIGFKYATTGYFGIQFIAQEFSTNYGPNVIWSLDSAAVSNTPVTKGNALCSSVDPSTNTGCMIYPSLTPSVADSPDLYFGYERGAGILYTTGGKPTTPSPSYFTDTDLWYDSVTYNTNVTSAAGIQPVVGQNGLDINGNPDSESYGGGALFSAKATTGTGVYPSDPLHTLNINYQASGTPAGSDFSGCPNILTMLPTWQNWTPVAGKNCSAGILRLDIFPSSILSTPVPITSTTVLPTSGLGPRTALQQQTLTLFIIPENTGATSPTPIVYDPDSPASGGNIATLEGKTVEAYCNPNDYPACQFQLQFNSSLSPQPSSYYVNLRSIYQPSTVYVNGVDTSSKAVAFSGAQALVDSTGIASDVLRRVQVLAPDTAFNNNVPQFALQSTKSICKLFTYAGGTASGLPPQYPAAISGSLSNGNTVNPGNTDTSACEFPTH